MFDPPSLVARIAIGKGIGFVFGLLGLLIIPYFMPDAGWLFRIGVLLWYTTLGAILGIFGVFTRHPVLNLPMPWWFRGPFLGAWMNFVLTFFAYDTFAAYLAAGTGGMLQSPFWFVAEGALFGLIVGYAATRFGGEGKETVGN